MGYQHVLISVIYDFATKNYQRDKLHRLSQEVVDINCQSHKFFNDCHESHTWHNVVRLEDDGIMCFDPQEMVKKCIKYYTQSLDVQVFINDNVKKNRDVFFNGEDEMEHVVSRLTNDKSHGGMD